MNISMLQRWLLLLSLTFGCFAMVPNAAAEDDDFSYFSTAVTQSSNGGEKWKAFQKKLKGFAVIVLLVMVVIAAVMAAMQQVKWAINVGIAGVILFGGTYVLAVISEGFN